MNGSQVKAIVLTGFGINCDRETQYALNTAGALADRVHVHRLIPLSRQGGGLSAYHILVVDGGFSWADDHGAGVLLGLKLRAQLGTELEDFIASGKLVIGICNGFQALVNMGLLPGFDGDYRTRSVGLTANDCGNFRDDWVRMAVDPQSVCVFTRNMDRIELPVRHGEGKFYAPPEVIERLKQSGQVVLRYCSVRDRQADPAVEEEFVPANGRFPDNPNGSLDDIAGICDSTGRVFGLMPHPEAFHHLTNHPDWPALLDRRRRQGLPPPAWEGQGLKIFRNAVTYVREHLL